MMPQNVRVRFAPSPTGPLHIGGLRTALFNYLFARSHGGKFVLRIEDTDQSRYVEGAEDYIVEALNWCGLTIDEGPGIDSDYGPYRQSERTSIYKGFIEELIENDKAYYAFDTVEKLDSHRKDHEAKGKTFIYNWHNRQKLDNSLTLSAEETQRRLEAGEPYVVRFLSPSAETVEFEDLIRGIISINSSTLDDKILYKSDGMPTYHLANVVDDHLMEITHVIRGEEWLPSLALHVLLYRAFGWSPPSFAHLPLIMKPTGQGKLSKRDGEKFGFPVFPLSWKESVGYREAGYFPETVINFLAMLGWNPGDEREIFGLAELVQEFKLERVNKAGARFDHEKTKWYNRHYLQEKSIEFLAEDFRRQFPEDLKSYDDLYIQQVIGLIKERATFVSDFWELGSYFFEKPSSYSPKVVKKQWKGNTADLLSSLAEHLKSIQSFEAEALEADLARWIESQDLPFGKVMAPLRLSLVGDLKGPHVSNIMALLGKEETLGRIDKAITELG